MKNEDKTIHPIRYIFCNNVRKIRRLKDISQETLAFDAGISRVYLSGIENGNKAQLLRPDLYEKFHSDETLSFYFCDVPEREKTD